MEGGIKMKMGSNIKRILSFIVVISMFVSMSSISFAKNNKGKDNGFEFERIWNKTNNTINSNWYNIKTTIENDSSVQITITWTNPGQGSKEIWYSLNGEDVIYHQLKENGNKDLIDDIVIEKNSIIDNKLYILIQEGNGNGAYKKSEVDLELEDDEETETDTEIKIKAPVNMVRNTNKNQALINEEITVSYKFQPQPILAENIIPEAYLKDKDIIVVMDTSGSMDWDLNGNSSNSWYYDGPSRMDIAKNAAELFVNNLKDDERVNISLVTYDYNAEIRQDIVNLSSNYTNVINKIRSFTAYGGTNIGDGLRRAYHRFTDSDSRKYIVLLTDGEPNWFTYDKINSSGILWWKHLESIDYKKDEGASNKIQDSNYYGLDYAKVISNMIGSSSKDINNFFIAFSSAGNSNKLKEISEESNGYYKEALDAQAINDVYDKISEQIASDLPIYAINFEETFPKDMEIIDVPQGMEMGGQTVTGDIGSINYNLNEEKTYFEADPFEFSIKLRARNTGEYILGDNNSSYITYTDIDGTPDTKKYFPESRISIYENQPPDIEATMTNNSNEQEYILNINVDEPSDVEMLDYNNVPLWIGASSPGNTSIININKDNITENYIKVKATDSFNNEVIESVPVVYLTSIDVEDGLNENNKRNATINIQTENNSTISEIKVNNNLVANNLLTNNGQYSYSTELGSGNNNIEIESVNEYGNTFIFTDDFLLDTIPPAMPTIHVSEGMPEGGDLVKKINISYPSDSVRNEFKINDGSWQEYNGEITTNEDIIIYARCFDSDKNESPEASAEIKILEPIEGITIKTLDNSGSANIIPNGKVIAKLQFKVNSNLTKLNFDIGSDADDFTMKYIKLIKDGGLYTEASVINDHEIIFPASNSDLLTPGIYECQIEFTIVDDFNNGDNDRKLTVDSVNIVESHYDSGQEYQYIPTGEINLILNKDELPNIL